MPPIPTTPPSIFGRFNHAMTDRPTHRHKATGDIVFWGEHLDPDEHERLPDGYLEKEHRETRLKSEIAGIKAEAERRILAKWPIHKQLNAMHEPYAEWVVAMRREIKAIRDWSNREEEKLASRQL